MCRTLRLASFVAPLLVSQLGCAGTEEERVVARSNLPPRAALRAPVLAPLGQPVRFDATASADKNGGTLVYIFEFNDGTPPVHSTEPVITHTFVREAVYTVLVRVIDGHGGEGLAGQDVSVRSDYPEVPDFCDAAHACVVGDDCDAGVCYTNGGSLD